MFWSSLNFKTYWWKTEPSSSIEKPGGWYPWPLGWREVGGLNNFIFEYKLKVLPVEAVGGLAEVSLGAVVDLKIGKKSIFSLSLWAQTWNERNRGNKYDYWSFQEILNPSPNKPTQYRNNLCQ